MTLSIDENGSLRDNTTVALTSLGIWFVKYFLKTKRGSPKNPREFTDCWQASRKNTLEDIREKLLIYEDVGSGNTLEALGYKQGLQRNKALQFIDTELKKIKNNI